MLLEILEIGLIRPAKKLEKLTEHLVEEHIIEHRPI
jgi:hypothetical protein